MNSDRKSTIGAALERWHAKKRMTVAQGAMLAQEYERLCKQVFNLHQHRDNCLIDLEVEKEFHQALISQWNMLCNMLDKLLHVRVYGNVTDEWIADDATTHEELARSKSIAETFEAVLKLRLAEKDQGKWN